MSLTAEILKQFEGQTELLELVPSSGGAFEVDVDGVRLFSKLTADRFPANAEVIRAIREKVAT